MAKPELALTEITSIQNVKQSHIDEIYLGATAAEQKWMEERAEYWDKNGKNADGKLSKRTSFASFRKEVVDKFLPHLTIGKVAESKSKSLAEHLKAAKEKATK